MEITGKIKRVENTEKVSEKFQKRRVIVEITAGKYPQVLEFTLVQGNVDAANGINPGDDVRVHFELKGREVTDKHSRVIVFNTLEAFRIDVTKKAIDFAPAPEAVENEVADDTVLPF